MTGPAPRLPLRTRIFAGLGTVGFGIKDQGFGGLLMLFYNQVLGLPASQVGFAIMVALIVDALCDPVIGHLSDQHRSRWGRRHPFLYGSAVPLSLFFMLLWMPPALSPAGLLAYLFVIAISVRVALSFYEIPSLAMVSELTTNYDDRTALVAWRFFFGYIGGVGMTIIAFRYMLVPTAEQPVGQLNRSGYALYGWVSAVLIFVFVLASALGTHDRIATLRSQTGAVAERWRLATFFGALRTAMLNRAYASVLVAMLLFSVVSGLQQAIGIYINTYFWQLSATQIATLSSGALLGAFLAFVVAQPASARLGKKRAAMILYALPLAVNSAPLIAGLTGVLPLQSPPVLPILMIGITVGTMASIAGSILAISMVADVSERVQLGSGQKSEGLLFSIVVLINKAVSGIGVFASGLLLTALAFPAQAQPGRVPAGLLEKLAITYIGVGTGFSALAILALAFYPITRADHEEAVRRLDAAPAD